MIIAPLAFWLGLQAPAYEYTTIKVEGWTVHAERKILSRRPRLWAAARNELTCQLMRIERAVPDGPLGKLKTVHLWIHLDNPANVGAAYHPSREWLVAHDQDPQMAHGVEFGNVEHLVSWPYQQPWMTMHELAHAYHDLFLAGSGNNADVIAAYDAAVASHKYDSVLWYDGGKRRAYAITNKMEYFAETSEAYFGQNDGYPFVRAELMSFDPAGYDLMRKVWGDPVTKIPGG